VRKDENDRLKDEEQGLASDSEGEASDELDENDLAASDEVDLDPIDMEEDTYGMSVCSLTRDTYHISKEGCSCARVMRLMTSLFLVVVTIGMQIALLHYVKKYVSAKAVHDIRISYSRYENHVYNCTTCTTWDEVAQVAQVAQPTNDTVLAARRLRGHHKAPKCLNSTDTGHCYKTCNGKWRGIAAFYPGDAEAMRLLETMHPDDQNDVCHIPLSHPTFFGLILVIWVLTVLQELRKSVNLSWVVLALPTTDSMANAIESNDAGQVIVAMTCFMKVMIIILTFIPRVLITLFLAWVGMRWLLATTSFGDLILNAVALEFILYIKEVIYGAVMPTRSVHDLQQTKISPHPKRMSAAWFNFTSSVSLLFFAVLTVVLYMKYFQAVLPQYNWDVHEVCKAWIIREYAV